MRSDVLYVSPEHGLYVGQLPPIDWHQGHTACLVFGLDDAVAVEDASGNRHVGSLVYVPPGGLHRPHFGSRRVGVLYVEVGGYDCARLRARFGAHGAAAVQAIDVDRAWRPALRALAAGSSEALPACVAHILSAVGPEAAAPLDPRIARAVRRLRATPSVVHPVAELAADARLSASRFQHLFADQLGLPPRRLRLWLMLREAVRRAAQGASLTMAAIEAGFADSAHFANTFRSSLGLAPSTLLLARTLPRVHLAST